jgi:hypothetical protein
LILIKELDGKHGKNMLYDEIVQFLPVLNTLIYFGISHVKTAAVPLTLLSAGLLYASGLYCSIILIDECSKTGYR